MMSDSEILLAVEAPERHGVFGRYSKVVALTSALLAAVVAAAATSVVTIRAVLPHGDTRSITGLDGMMVVKPAYENCAQAKDNCLITRCCAPAGYNCFKTSQGTGKCMRACTPGGLNGTCEGVAPHMKPVVEQPGGSLFCFAVYTEDTGSSKPNHELELLKMQKENSASLFSCAEWAVFGDVEAPLGGGAMTIKVDIKGDFHLMKRKEAKTWVNTG